jgi:hypothetical protein
VKQEQFQDCLIRDEERICLLIQVLIHIHDEEIAVLKMRLTSRKRGMTKEKKCNTLIPLSLLINFKQIQQTRELKCHGIKTRNRKIFD